MELYKAITGTILLNINTFFAIWWVLKLIDGNREIMTVVALTLHLVVILIFSVTLIKDITKRD